VTQHDVRQDLGYAARLLQRLPFDAPEAVPDGDPADDGDEQQRDAESRAQIVSGPDQRLLPICGGLTFMLDSWRLVRPTDVRVRP